MKSSLLILAFFCTGILAGRFLNLPQALSDEKLTICLLYLLMGLVGITIGSDRRLREILRSLSPRVLLLPLGTTVGTFLGVALASLFLQYTLWQCLAVGSGFAYYSLSSILISQTQGSELGTVALISNILREAFTLLLAPLVAKIFGPHAAVSMGGATTMDTTLPILAKTLGTDWVFIAILHAVMLDFSVPFWVLFFCSL